MMLVHFTSRGKMTYTLFESCPTIVCGQTKGGASITCGYHNCRKVEVIAVNKVKRHGEDDAEIIERMVANKFERLGWKVGKTPKQHLCPECFIAVKSAAIRKKEARMSSSEKVVPINNATSAPRPMTRDERYLIFKKIDEFYVGENVGYSNGWNDDKIAKDLGVPVAFVAVVREESFGPNIDEHTVKIMTDAKTLLADIRQAATTIEPMIKQVEPFMKQLQDLVARSSSIEKMLEELSDDRL
jgi:hypothetical protein